MQQKNDQPAASSSPRATNSSIQSADSDHPDAAPGRRAISSFVGERADLGKPGAEIAPPRKAALPDQLDRGLGSLPLAVVGDVREVDQILLIPRAASGVP